MRALILGGRGILDHKLWKVVQERFETWVTERSSYSAHSCYRILDLARARFGVDAFYIDSVVSAVVEFRPHVVRQPDRSH